MSEEEIVFSMADGIGWLVLNRPAQRNAITEAMWRDLIRLIETAESDRNVRVLGVRGAGQAAFAAGANLDDVDRLASGTVDAQAYVDIYSRAQRVLYECRKPTIAMIYGHCLGAGCGIATACDFRFAADTAQFGIPAARAGQVYRLEETRRLVRLVGLANAKIMLFSGRLITAEQASRFGLVNQLVSAEALERETLAFARELASASQFSIQSMKRVLACIEQGQMHDDETTTALFLDALHGEDYREARSALKERRPPNFSFS